MRANEFLIEYRRDVTIQKLGQPLYQKMLSDKNTRLSLTQSNYAILA